MVQKINKLEKLLVIGGSGYIGKSLKDYTKKKKNFRITSYSRSEKKNLISTKKLVESNYIIYCINNTNIGKSLRYFKYFKKLLEKNKIKPKILFISSGAVYGPRSKIKKISEKDEVSISKINLFNGYKKNYAKEKFIVENEFIKLSKIGYQVAIARGFTFYGRHILNYNYAFSQMVNCIKFKKKFIIKNKNTFRSYMHSDDMCKWLLTILKFASFKCPIYNVGCEKIINLRKLSIYLSKKYNLNLTINSSNNKKGDFYVPSTRLARRNLKLKTSIIFKDAINSIVN